MAVKGVNEQLTEMVSRFSELRTGTVLSVDAMKATVEVGTTVIRAAYIRQAEPVAGDVVAVMRQGASWSVMGTSSVSGGNAIANPSFEDIDSSGRPVGWTLYDATGTSVFSSVYAPEEAPEGEYVLEIMPAGGVAATAYVYSSPIAVAEGDTWEFSVHVNGHYPSTTNENTTDVSIRLMWFADATDLYPTTSAADTTPVSLVNITEDDVMQVMRGTAVIPVGAVFMRVAMRQAAQPGAGAHFDFATARKVT